MRLHNPLAHLAGWLDAIVGCRWSWLCSRGLDCACYDVADSDDGSYVDFDDGSC